MDVMGNCRPDHSPFFRHRHQRTDRLVVNCQSWLSALERNRSEVSRLVEFAKAGKDIDT